MAESQGGDGKGAIPAKRAMAGVTQDAPVVPPCGACKFLRRKCSGVGVSLHLTLGQTKVREKKKRCLALAMCPSSYPIFRPTTAMKPQQLFPMRLRLGCPIQFMVVCPPFFFGVNERMWRVWWIRGCFAATCWVNDHFRETNQNSCMSRLKKPPFNFFSTKSPEYKEKKKKV
jgi:hypothetical protein